MVHAARSGASKGGSSVRGESSYDIDNYSRGGQGGRGREGERRRREQLQADMERLEQEQKVRLAALEDEQRRATQPLQPVGLRVTMDETYEEVEGAEGAFAAGLKADLAAAVSASVAAPSSWTCSGAPSSPNNQ